MSQEETKEKGVQGGPVQFTMQRPEYGGVGIPIQVGD